MIGHLTIKTRKIRIINMLTKHDDILEVSYKLCIDDCSINNNILFLGCY